MAERRKTSGILASALGRRLLLQVLLCAVLPLAVLAWVGLEESYDRLEMQAQKDLGRETRMAVLSLYERLHILQADLQDLVQPGRDPAQMQVVSRKKYLATHFRHISTVSESDSRVLLGEAQGLPPTLDNRQLNHLRQAGVILQIAWDGRAPGVWLGVRLDQIGNEMIWGEVDPEYLWQGPLVSGGLELAVFGEHNELLFATLEPGEADGISARMRQLAGDRFFDFEYAGEEYVAARRRCLLKRRFGTDWEVAVGQRRDLWYADIVPVRNRSILIGCLATLLVILVTSEQMRRTLVPLQSIRQGITAVEDQRYDEPVILHSGDEFEELGNAFNRMTYRLAAITADRDRYEANLVESRDRAIKTARLESEFLANVSHELRTPMTSIRSFAEILREYADEDREHRQEFLDIIVSESERLTRLIEQILSFSKVQSGAEPWSFQILDIRESVKGMCQGLAPVAAEGKVTLHTEFQDDLPKTAGDDHGLRQVWINLVSNAIKFSEPGQEVTVRVHADQGSIIVEVEDHGPGIDPDDHQVIFGRFRQACSDFLTDKPRGTGLGLSIAEAIVRRHRGKIEVDSAPGEGSTFRVILPIVDVDSLKAYEDLTELQMAIHG